MNQPTPERPDLQTIYERWDEMAARVAHAEAERKQSHEMNIKLVAEGEVLRDQIEALTKQLNYYRNFGIAISERMAMIGDVVDKSLHEAREFARTAPHARAHIVAEEGTAEVDIEGEELRGILTRVPMNGGDNRLPRAGY